MGREEEMIKERGRKIDELVKQKISLYPNKFDKEDSIATCLKSKMGKKVKTAGRILSKRDIGRIIFCDLQDDGGKIQIVFQDKETPEKQKEFFRKYMDIGDFAGIEGKIFKTKTKQLSILVSKIELLSKSVLPLPEKWHGLQDKEERYRKRYLDLIMNPEIKEVFLKKAAIIRVIREFMADNKFVEVETSLLQSVYGGANAKPFKTHCDAYNSDLYLSIAPELYLKKALVGGFERVYEITKKFRNEGVDKQHNPEHMTVEWYQAYADYNEGMRLFEELMKLIAKKLYGKTIIEYQGQKIDFGKWKKMSLSEAIKKYLNEDISKIKNDEDAKKIAKKHNLNFDGITKVNLPDELLKLFREKLIQPTFLTDYPIELAPLAKTKAEDKSKAEIFQPFVGGMELARAYSELNDPKIQEEHFKEQENERKKGNKEAMPTDNDFVEALKYGMPPACGVGIGIDRLVMLFTNQNSMRDVILFPFMKPEDASEEKK
ncbi:MAG: lysine--tRNA ligase [Nanoarchaeota archaeon]|nr:lysine--tRNA ligase [Nanoarchaeota archaeon]